MGILPVIGLGIEAFSDISMIALNLKGTLPRGFPLLGSAKSSFKKLSRMLATEFVGMNIGGVSDEEDGGNCYALVMQVHPLARPFRVRVCKPDQILVEAETGEVGPGYHQLLCEVFGRTGVKLGVTWDLNDECDPTGFFQRQDRWNLEAAFLSQLNDAVCDLIDFAEDNKCRELNLFMPGPDRFHHGDLISSPMGPRDERWAEAVSHDPSQGVDVYAWWEPGKDANYFFARAMSILWTQLRPRRPMTSFEQAHVLDMLNCFDRAWLENRNLRFPWREWHLFLSMTDRNSDEELVRKVGENAARESVSRGYLCYRQGDYTAVFGEGWELELPTGFAEQYSPDGGMWQGWDGKRTVQVGVIPIADPDDPQMHPDQMIKSVSLTPPDGEDSGKESSWQRNGMISRSNLHQVVAPDGRHYWRLGTVTVTKGSILNMTINFDEAKMTQWAMGVWEKIKNRSEV